MCNTPKKRKYPTQRIAIKNALQASKAKGKKYRVYRCDKHWHTTTMMREVV